MRYNTGNPVEPNGSDDPRDLYDNTQVFDKFVTSLNFSEKDRLGVDRLTWAGAENEWRQMLQGSGFETVHLSYVDGAALTVSRPTQLVDRAGITYSVKLPANFPLTLGGNWAADQALLTDRADNPLRQQLSSVSDPTLGAALIGRSSVTIASIKEIGAQLKDSTRILVLQSYHPGRTYGGGKLMWAPSVPKSKHDGFLIFSPTVPAASVTTAQSTIISYMNRTGETDASGSGCWVRLFSGAAHMEWGGVTAGTDCGLVAQKLVDFCVPNGVSLHCDEVLTLGSTVTIPQYRTDPAVARVFNHSCVSLRSVVSTMTSGETLRFNTSGADLEIGELNGPGPDVGATRGIRLAGQGGGRVRVNFVQGFQNGVHLEESYAHTVHVGWIDNCIRGIALVNANDNRVTGGRVGGRYSTVAAVGPTDPTTCEVGVDVGDGCASNRFTMNIEYCRRSVTSIGFNDRGIGTQFSGYIESCVAWNAYLSGRNALFNILPGGSITRADNCGFFAGDTNRIVFEAQQDFHNETPSDDKNTLTFQSLQALATSGTGDIRGYNGLASYPRTLGSARNEVVSGNSLGSTSWSATGAGGASVSGIFSSSNVGIPELGLLGSTQVTLPALAADGAEYIISQGSINMAVGPFSFGMFAFCAAGDVDIYVRVISSDATIQHRIVTRLVSVSGGGFKRIATELNNAKADPLATYQIRLRSAAGCTLYICGAFAINRTDVEVPAVNTGAVRRSVIPGSEVRGRMFPNGVALNGMIQKDYRVATGVEVFDTEGLMFSTLILSGAGYNVTLPPGGDGQELVLKKDGASGTVGVLLFGTTVDGSSAGITMNPLDTLRLRFVPAFGWLKV
ncbi:TPA: hypothetical protein ACHTCR_005968 [Pseudomonas putida]